MVFLRPIESPQNAANARTYKTRTGTNKMHKTNALYLKTQGLIAETHLDTYRDTQRDRQTDTQRHTHPVSHTQTHTKSHTHTNK